MKMNGLDIKKLVEDLQRLKTESDVPSDEFSKKEDTYSVVNPNIVSEITHCSEPEIKFVVSSYYNIQNYIH